MVSVRLKLCRVKCKSKACSIGVLQCVSECLSLLLCEWLCGKCLKGCVVLMLWIESVVLYM